MMERYKIEELEKWRDVISQIPFLKFPHDWNVKIIPPFAGAMARFLVEKNGKTVSVYLDWYENLGLYGGNPYWEAYPVEDENIRFDLNDTNGLLSAIEKELNT